MKKFEDFLNDALGAFESFCDKYTSTAILILFVVLGGSIVIAACIKG